MFKTLLSSVAIAAAAILPGVNAHEPGDEKPATAETKTTDALYIRHFGEQDKAILALVIVDTEPSAAELIKRLGEDDSEEARVVVIDTALLRTVLSDVHSRFSKTEEVSVEPNYGAFEVTVVEDPSRAGRALPAGSDSIRRQLARADASALFERLLDLEKAAADRSESMRNQVAATKGRLVAEGN